MNANYKVLVWVIGVLGILLLRSLKPDPILVSRHQSPNASFSMSVDTVASPTNISANFWDAPGIEY